MDTTRLQQALRTNVIEHLGLQSLPEEEKLRTIDMLTNLIVTKLMMRIDEKLSAGDRETFGSLLDGENEEGVAEWLKSKEIDLYALLAEEVAQVKDDLGKRTETLP